MTPELFGVDTRALPEAFGTTETEYLIRCWDKNGEPFLYREENLTTAREKAEELARTCGMAQLFQLVGTAREQTTVVWGN